MIEHITQCRACGNANLKLRLMLPAIYPSLFTARPEPPADWPKVPLELGECQQCRLVQLMHSFSPDAMYRTYWYKSALNRTMVAALADVAAEGAKAAKLEPGDTVLDIGCNDGTLLQIIGDRKLDVYRIGFDPSQNLAAEASSRCEMFVNDFFGPNTGRDKAKLITAIAMFYDLPKVIPFLESVLTWLHPNGVFVIQMTDLYSMMRQNAFDNIVHEHLEYWSLRSLIAVCERAHLDVFRVTENDVNGGSIRAFCCHKNTRPIEPGVANFVQRESTWIDVGWPTFINNLHRTLSALRAHLKTARQDGKLVVGIGASTKGNTLLQLLEADPSQIHMIGEVSKDKFGMHTIGTAITIVPEETALAASPDYVLVLPWHFAASMIEKLKGYNVVLPMPVPKLNGQPLW
jgi:SAM-dependent methyltransferase